MLQAERIRFIDLAADPVNEGVLSRTGAVIKFHDGTAARQLAAHGVAALFPGLTVGDGTAADQTVTFSADTNSTLHYDDGDDQFEMSKGLNLAAGVLALGGTAAISATRAGTLTSLQLSSTGAQLSIYETDAADANDYFLVERNSERLKILSRDADPGTWTHVLWLEMDGDTDIRSGDLKLGGTIVIDSSRNIFRAVTAGITASVTQTQGQGALTADLNEISVCANTNDTVTLPTAVAGRKVVVINNGANTAQIFPASGDNLGAGVDTATTLAAGSNVTYAAYDATNWESV